MKKDNKDRVLAHINKCPDLTDNFCTPIYVGENIEEKVDRLLATNQPIEDDGNQSKIYTKRSDGVLPEYDIRTDKWDVALSTFDEINRSKIAQSEALTRQIEGNSDTDTSGNT